MRACMHTRCACYSWHGIIRQPRYSTLLHSISCAAILSCAPVRQSSAQGMRCGSGLGLDSPEESQKTGQGPEDAHMPASHLACTLFTKSPTFNSSIPDMASTLNLEVSLCLSLYRLNWRWTPCAACW